MSKKLLFNLNKNVSQDYTYVKYTGTIVTATNTLEKPIKNAILKGDTKYRDVDTGEILDSFDGTKNLELVSVKMPVLMTTNQDNILGKCSVNVNHAYGGYIKKLTDTTGEFKVTNSSQDVKIRVNGVNTIIGRDKLCYVTVLFGEDMSNVNFNMRRGWTLLKDNRTLVFKELTYGGNDIGGLILTSNQGLVLNQLYTFEVISVVPILSTWTFDDYEPYKTNILTTPEGVVLRKIDDTTLDELNVINEEHIQRVGEFKPSREVLQIHYPSVEKCHRIKIYWRDIPNIKMDFNRTKRLCNILNTCYSESVVGIFSHGMSYMYLLNVDVNIAPTPEDAIQWLLDNDVTILYELETPIIKTVDLSILDQDENTVTSISSFNDTTHVTTSSDTVPPIFEGYIATKESVE